MRWKMKNFIRSILTTFIIVSSIFMVASCGNNPDGEKEHEKSLIFIYVDNEPQKKQYSIGEELDTTGLKVVAQYSDYSEKEVTDSCIITGFDSKTSGQKTVIISYTEGSITETADFSVYVQENTQESPKDNPDDPDDNTESFTAGDIILSDGTIVKKDDYASIDSSNPPVAVVVVYSDDNTVLGIGLHTADQLMITPDQTYGYFLNASECTIHTGSSSSVISYASAKTATFSGIEDGFNIWRIIYNTTYNNETAVKEYPWEVLDAKTNFPAYYWANTYGETYSDHLGNATSGWFVPAISQMATIYNEIENINKGLEIIKKLDGSYSSGPLSGYYWSSSNCSYSNTISGSDVSAWNIDFDTGLMHYHYKNTKYNVLAVRYFGSAVTTDDATLYGIAVTQAPETTEYVVNSDTALNTTGLKVMAYYSTHSVVDVTEQVTIDSENKFDLSETNDTQLLTIRYDGKTTQFPVAVIEQPVLQALSIKGEQDYLVGEELSIQVTALYSTGSPKDITEKAIITGFDSSKPAWNQSVSISYTENDVTKETSYLVSINKYSAGSIILSDGTVVSKDNFHFDSNNLPVAVVAGTTSAGKTLGVGLYTTHYMTEKYKWRTFESNTSAYDNLVCTTKLSTTVKYPAGGYGMDAAKDATFDGDTDGSNNLDVIKNLVIDNFSDINNYPAFKWISSYGDKFGDYLGGVTDGWYIPSISELCTVYKNIESINETLGTIYDTIGLDNYHPDYVGENKVQILIPMTTYWTSSPHDRLGLNAWFVDFYYGIGYTASTHETVHSVLAVHSFD